ncbi:hypothetical protein [Flaviflexus huanghaiensis]|uniref:hypothetical protein n=1 Tax=Flaviflexus huanghaiensis TaxID=1111473 RepID=UPI0015F8EEEE|nr:hypothetical protein [Flaviflexus huanghaiensis]
MTPLSNHRVILWSTALVLLGLFLSVIGLALHEFTPIDDRSWAPAITAVATLGLTLGGIIILTRGRDDNLQNFARRMWKIVAYATAGAIVLAAITAAILIEPVLAFIIGLVAIQGPVGAWFLSEQFAK